MTHMAINRALLLVLLFASCQQEVLSLNVVQLGDSYASGNGAGSYFGGDCHRSTKNWGNTAANLLNAASYNNQACSGSEVSALASQDNAIDSDTDLVLLGTGGNDLGFEDVVLQCFVPTYRSRGDCYDMMNRARGRLTSFKASLRSALGDMKAQLNDDAIVVLVAYPHITQNTEYTATCCDFTDPNWDVINALRDLGDVIEDAQRDAVSGANSDAGGTFVHLYDGTKALFEGHEPDPDAPGFFGGPGINPNGWIYELPLGGVEEFESYHLDPRGHSELGKALAPFVENLLPETAAPVPTPPPTSLPTTSPTLNPTLGPTRRPSLRPASTPTTASPTPWPTPVAPTIQENPDNGDDGGGGICFSEVATVQVENRPSPVAMQDLRIGDRVLTSHQVYQPVYAFAHEHKTQPAAFLQISTTTGKGSSNNGPLEMSGEHMVYVQGKRTPVRADSIQVGDALVLVGGASNNASTAAVVDRITMVERKGLYAPLTPSGSIVVDGILASTYVGVQKGSSAYVELGHNRQHSTIIHQADAIHMWLSPLRLACMGVSSKFCDRSYHNQEDGMHQYVATSLQLVAWGETQPLVVQAVLLLLVLLVAVAFQAIEFVVLGASSYGPLIMLLVAAVAAWKSSTTQGKVTKKIQ